MNLTLKLVSENLTGGYIRYAKPRHSTRDMPDFWVVCDPGKDPLPLIERAFQEYMENLLVAEKLRLNEMKVVFVNATEKAFSVINIDFNVESK